MDVFINAFGSKLSRDKGMLLVEQEGEVQRLSAVKIDSICLTTACEVTTDALLLATRHEIPIVLVDRQGRPIGRWWQPTYGNRAAIRRGQFLMRGSETGMGWMKSQLLQKADSQYELLHQLQMRKSKRGRHLPEIMTSLKQYRKQLAAMGPEEEVRTFTQLEGHQTKAYFKALSSYLPPAFQFKGRSRRPAMDPFNALLNYLYGILYKHGERSLLLAGIDPNLGVWHSERWNQAAMAFDFIEVHRCWADWVALNMVLGGKLEAAHFQPKENGFWLSRSGRKMAVIAFQEFLHKKVQRHRKRRSRLVHLQLEAHALATRMQELGEKKVK